VATEGEESASTPLWAASALALGAHRRDPPCCEHVRAACVTASHRSTRPATPEVSRAPCHVRGTLPKDEQRNRALPTADGLIRLAEQLRPDQEVFMWVGAELGLRWAEVAGLTADRINFDAKQITVDRQLTRSGDLSAPKTQRGRRTMACPQGLLEDLADVLKRRGVSPQDTDALVFTSPSGHRLNYTNWLKREWRPACIESGLPDLLLHRSTQVGSDTSRRGRCRSEGHAGPDGARGHPHNLQVLRARFGLRRRCSGGQR